MEPDIDKIDAYLSGSMTGAERKAFEAEMADNPALAEEVEAFRLAREAVELSIGDRLRAQFSEWGEVEATGTKTEEAKVVQISSRQNLRRILAIAAGVMLLLAVGSFWYVNDQFSNQQLALSYYQETPLNEGPTRSPGEAKSALTDAVEALKAGNYIAADAYFQSVAPGDENYSDARLYLAHSLYRQEKSEEAIEILDSLSGAVNPNTRETAAWLTVLSYLQLGQTGNVRFRDLLADLVADSGHSYHQKAVDLNKKLRSLWYDLAN